MSLRHSDLEKRALTRLGTVVRGKYRLDSLLGIGGMAAVYRATHRNQAELAIKMLHPELSLYEDFKNRFLREGYAANSVKHPSVVLVLDDDVTEDGSAFLVMELLRGSSVDALRKARGRLSPLEAAAVGIQVLDVLRAAHEKGIVHRDIKPANLFVTHDGTVKVLDFGIARARDEAAPEEQVTGTGVLLGTPAFMAPEQANAKASEIDARTDLWAMGATLFTLISGKSVHQADNPTRALVCAASLPAPPLSQADAGAPALIAEVVDRALAFDKEKRWADAKAMRRALTDACRATFGDVPAKAVLADLLGPAESAPPASTRLAEGAVVPPSIGGVETRIAPVEAFAPPAALAHAPTPPAPPAPNVDAAEALLSPLSSTTAQPVSSVSTPPSKGSRRKGVWAAVALVACGGVVVASAVRTLGHLDDAAPAAVAAPTPFHDPKSTPVANAPPPAPAPAPPPAAPPPAPAPEVQASAEVPAPAEPVKPAPAAREPAPSMAAEAPAARPPRKPAPASKRPDCTPNYTLDKDGNKHFKPECF
jgi:serine/threonine-protein kinase